MPHFVPKPFRLALPVVIGALVLLSAAVSTQAASGSDSTSARSATARSGSTQPPTAGSTEPQPAARTTARAAMKSAQPSEAKPTSQQETARQGNSGMLGRQSGDRHLAYRHNGSSLDSLWPPKMPEQLPGAILPNKRIVAFYGNPLSTRMGILGEFEPQLMLRKLDEEVAEWQKADPNTPVQPALHLIAEVANPHPGPSGKYRTRMDSSLIEKVHGWARSKNALMFVDLQIGQSTLQDELPWIEKFLKRPDVHLGIDPEFAMKHTGGIPGKRIGSYDADDINFAIRFLANLVDRHNLPPKILVVHRFTQRGLVNYQNIRLDPRVQVVIQMDGFGAPWLKRDSFYSYIKKEPVQYAGWKQFTKPRNDNPRTTRESILRLWPVPVYIQLQ